MSNIKLDLKQFKHVSSNDKTTTLQHKQGHTLTLAHNALSKEAQKQLAELAKISKQDSNSGDKAEAKQDSQTQMAAGGEIANKGAEKAPKKEPQPYKAPKAETKYEDKPSKGNGAVRHMLAEGAGPANAPEELHPPVQNNLPGFLNTVKDYGSAMVDSALGDQPNIPQDQEDVLAPQVAPPSVSPPGQAVAASPEGAATPPPPEGAPLAQQSAPNSLEAAVNGAQNDIRSGYADQIQGEKALAAARGGLGEQEAKVAHRQAENEQYLSDNYQHTVSQLNQELQNHIEDVQNGYIDPNKYWTGYKDTATGKEVAGHSKMAAAIGMLIAGFNPTSMPNAAINMLKFQMEQSLEAQKQNLNSNHNLVRANLEQFRNMRDATDMSRIMMNQAAEYQLKEAAGKAASPLAKAAALQAIGPLERQRAVDMQNFAMRQTMMKLASDPNRPNGAIGQAIAYQRMLNPEGAKEMESRYVPNLDGKEALAQRPMSPTDRKEIEGHQKFDNAAQDLQHFISENGGVLDRLNPQARAVAAQKAMVIQALFREGTLGTVYREGEQPLLDKAVKGQPLSFLGYFTEPAKLEELKGANDRAFDTLRQSYGLPVKDPIAHLPPEQQALFKWAKSHPENPKSALVLKKLGLGQ